jgi:hypothetical protein
MGRFMLLLFTSAIPAIAAATTPTLALRAGGVFEGPQHTLTSGFVAGGSVEWPRTFGALGIALEWAGDSGDEFEGSASVFHVGAFGRWEIGASRVRPFLEAGIGVSHMDSEGVPGLLGSSVSTTGPGGWFGVGASMPVSDRLALRLDGRYSLLALESPNLVYGGGNMGDYFSVALSLAFVH